MRRMALPVALGALLAVMLSTCSGQRADQAPIATTSNEQVQAIAENLLAAYNLGDYQAFSRDLSLPAKLIVDENAFAEFRTENLSATGPSWLSPACSRSPADSTPIMRGTWCGRGSSTSTPSPW